MKQNIKINKSVLHTVRVHETSISNTYTYLCTWELSHDAMRISYYGLWSKTLKATKVEDL